MNYTTIEQSKKLLELGLNPKTADFEYQCVGFTMHTTRPTDDFKYNVMLKEQNIPHESKYDIPCWSLGTLINLMPSTIYKGGETFTLRIYKDSVYLVCYKSHYYLDEIWFSEENLLNAAFEMVCWLLENGYISRKENKI